MESDKREDLKNRLRNRLKLRNTKEKDENLSKLGINNTEDLMRLMDNIKDIDKEKVYEQLISMGLQREQREQIEHFFKMFIK